MISIKTSYDQLSFTEFFVDEEGRTDCHDERYEGHHTLGLFEADGDLGGEGQWVVGLLEGVQFVIGAQDAQVLGFGDRHRNVLVGARGLLVAEVDRVRKGVAQRGGGD